MFFCDGSTKVICSLACGDLGALRREMHSDSAAGADLLEFRLDYLQPPPTVAQLLELLAAAPRPVVVTCRPARLGGFYEGPEEVRLQLLRAAAAEPNTMVDLEADAAPQDFPLDKTILSIHDFDANMPDLPEQAQRLERSGTAAFKIAFAAASPRDALRALEILRQARKPAILLAMGEGGVASRILARKFGAARPSPRRDAERNPRRASPPSTTSRPSIATTASGRRRRSTASSAAPSPIR